MGALRPMNQLRRLLQAMLTGLLLALPTVALALDQYPPIICTGLFGCGADPSNLILTNALPTAGAILVQLAAGGAIIAIAIAGVQMGVSYGDDGAITNARKAILYALGGLALVLSATSIVSFVSTENYGFSFGGGDIVSVMAAIIRIMMTLFNVGFCLVVILAGLRMITSQGNADEFKKGGQMIMWAVIGGVIVNLAKAGVQAFLLLNL